MINTRLFDWYGIDTKKNLKIKNCCPRPFDTLLIDSLGSVYLCECQSWLPQSIGNIQIQSIDQILKSSMVRDVQKTILDGSYKLCNEHQCNYLKLFKPSKKSFLYNQPTYPPQHITNLRLGIDKSCNLFCPSCRKTKILVTKGVAYERLIKMAEKIIEWIKSQTQNLTIHVGSDGDPFASLTYRYIMSHLKTQKNCRYSLMTNGLLLKKQYNKFKHIFENTKLLEISMDGASPSTYEKLRLGGQWNNIIENLKFLSKIKNFETRLHVVLQTENYQEIEKFLEIKKKYKFDMLIFNQIQNWNTNLDLKEATSFLLDSNFLKIKSKLQNQTNVYFNLI
jgi:pyruvate-formate lyase-activating enzyme